MLAPSLLDVVQRMLLIIEFVGGKFRDLEANHENNENWHPTKITCYTACSPVVLILGSVVHLKITLIILS